MATADEMLEAAIEAGADDCESSEEGHVVYCNPDQLHQVAKVLEARFGEPRSVQIMWRAKTEVPIDEETGQKLLRMIDALEESDDVQQVYANFDVAEDVLRRLTAA
jgi:transcriptional/translational regulatory protein YebC/TACO1